MESSKSNNFSERFLARFIIEAKTPLAVGSGEKNIMTDALVATDVNGLPYIPGTAIAGVLRHAVGEEKAKLFFGFQDRSDSKNSIGSNITFTSAQMLGKDGEAIDGLKNIDFSDPIFYSKFKNLPIRQHCRIDSKGTATDGGKFDEQVVYKGTRFCFEIEMVSDGNNFSEFENVLRELHSCTIRIGGGTRSGFGEIEIIDCKYVKLDLTNNEQLDAYLEKSSSLADPQFWEDKLSKPIESQDESINWTKFELKLQPDDFILFGSGFGNENADITPVTEPCIVWEGKEPIFIEENILIPASSVKGAISHRVAFHYNKLTNVFADKVENIDDYIGKKNIAVKALFGSEGEIENNKMKHQAMGNVIFSDIIQRATIKRKILNHVSIDRFTGGAIDGALFTEEVIYGKDEDFTFKLLVNPNAFNDDENIEKAFVRTLDDLCKGMLPLGGGVNRGHGCFAGEKYRNGQKF